MQECLSVSGAGMVRDTGIQELEAEENRELARQRQ